MVQRGLRRRAPIIYRKAEAVQKAQTQLPHTNRYENVCVKKLNL